MSFVAAADSQSASPPCVATTRTAPSPVKLRLVPPLIVPGPEATEKVAGSPELAVADKPTTLVAHCGPGSGKVTVWTIRVMVNVAVAIPPYMASLTMLVTA